MTVLAALSRSSDTHDGYTKNDRPATYRTPLSLTSTLITVFMFIRALYTVLVGYHIANKLM